MHRLRQNKHWHRPRTNAMRVFTRLNNTMCAQTRVHKTRARGESAMRILWRVYRSGDYKVHGGSGGGGGAVAVATGVLPTRSDRTTHTTRPAACGSTCWMLSSLSSALIVRRITPNEWHDPQPWKDDNSELETKLNVANLIWFSCGTMLQQGSDISPQ